MSESNWYKSRALVFITILVFLTTVFVSLGSRTPPIIHKPEGEKGIIEQWCPLPALPEPFDDGLKSTDQFNDNGALEVQVVRLSDAVNVPTVSWDDNGDVNVDTRWEPFFKFHDVLEKTFPLVHKTLDRTLVNSLGLLYTWKGSDDSLKPILFTAHQDVVPAGPPEKWTYSPFEAHFDGQFLWGRGSSDCKNNLVGLLSTAESLLSQKWKPRRTVIFAFGYDEETGGERGGAYLAKELEKRYGNDGIAMVMDEGGMGVESYGEYAYALPAVAEKGYLDVYLTLEVNGGHSSRPPPHSGIGIMAEMIVALEQNPFKPRLTKENPFRRFLECQVRYSPTEVESWLKDALIGGNDGVGIGTRLAEARGYEVRFSMQTSQAVDIVNAGEKTNQLPETVTAVVNYRIAPHESIVSVKQHITDVVSPIATEHNITVRGFGKDEGKNEIAPFLALTSKDDLSPSPISPTGSDSKVWSVFSGVLRQVFEDIETFKGKTVVPVGDIMTGNTDTIHFWNISKNIYRFSPAREGTRMGIHTVDERIDMSAHMEGMRVYYDLIREFDRADI